MYNHAPENYECPFCSIVAGKDQPGEYTKQEDIIYQDEIITSWVNCRRWPNNVGNILIIPNKHYENLYDIPDDVLAHVYKLGKQAAIAMKKAYGCDGVSTRQHNEPAGSQEVWHYHLHVFPRYKNDDFYILAEKHSMISAKDRVQYAQKLRDELKNCLISP